MLLATIFIRKRFNKADNIHVIIVSYDIAFYTFVVLIGIAFLHMKVFYSGTIFLSLLLSFCAFSTLATKSNGIVIEGKISVQQGLTEGAVIQIFIDGQRLDDCYAGVDGSYKVELIYNHKYELVLTRERKFFEENCS